MENKATSYHVGDISLDEFGIYHVHFVGKVFGQGEIKPILLSGPDIGAILKTAVKNLQQVKPELLERINKIKQEKANSVSIN